MSSPDPDRQPGLALAQVFLRHAELDYNTDPLRISAQAEAEATITVSVTVTELQKDDGTIAAAITLRAQTTTESVHPCRFDVSLTGIVETTAGEENFAPASYGRLNGAAMMFPFLRETVANLTMRSRTGPLWLKPVNLVLADKTGQLESGESEKTTE